MAVFELQDASGQTYEIEAPSQEQALQAFRGFIGGQQAAPAPAVPEGIYLDPETNQMVDPALRPEPSMLDRALYTAGDIGRAGAAGMARGAAALADLPGRVVGGAQELGGELAARGLEALGVDLDPSFRAGLTAPAFPQYGVQDAASDVTGGATEFRGETLPGQISGTVGEFIPGAAAMGGGSVANLGRYAVAPGVASEVAGQLTAGTAAEPYARVAGALAAPAGVSLLSPRARGAIAPRLPGADAERVRQAQILQQSGVQPTAGQATGIGALRRAEGTLAPSGQQLEDFTAAALRSIGSTSRRATPEALQSAETSIINAMDDALRNVSVVPNSQHAQAVARIADDYIARVPSGTVSPRIQGISDEIADVATSPRPQGITLSRLREWRSDIGQMLDSNEAATRQAAVSLRNLIDGMTDGALNAAGRADDVAKLSRARVQYRNLVAIRDAASRAGEEAATGIITPGRLQSAVTRLQGRAQYATGGGTELAPLSRAGVAVLSPASPVAPGATRELAGLFRGALATGGALSGGGIPGAVAGFAAPTIARSALRSPPIQNLLLNPTSPIAGASRLLPGLMTGNQ